MLGSHFKVFPLDLQVFELLSQAHVMRWKLWVKKKCLPLIASSVQDVKRGINLRVKEVYLVVECSEAGVGVTYFGERRGLSSCDRVWLIYKVIIWGQGGLSTARDLSLPIRVSGRVASNQVSLIGHGILLIPLNGPGGGHPRLRNIWITGNSRGFD